MLPVAASDTGAFVFLEGRLRTEQLLQPPPALLEPHQAKPEIDHAVPDEVEQGIVVFPHEKETAAAVHRDAALPQPVGKRRVVAVNLYGEDAGECGERGHRLGAGEASVLD